MKHVYISHYYYTNITARKNFEHSHRTRKRNVDPFTRMKDTEFGEWNTQKYVEPNEDVSTSIKYFYGRRLQDNSKRTACLERPRTPSATFNSGRILTLHVSLQCRWVKWGRGGTVLLTTRQLINWLSELTVWHMVWSSITIVNSDQSPLPLLGMPLVTNPKQDKSGHKSTLSLIFYSHR